MLCFQVTTTEEKMCRMRTNRPCCQILSLAASAALRERVGLVCLAGTVMARLIFSLTDNKGFVVEPETTMLVKGFCRRIEIGPSLDHFLDPFILNLIYIN